MAEGTISRRGSGVGVIPFVATGGTITDVTISGIDYRVHTFTSSGTFEVESGEGLIDVFLVGGGGGGNNASNGGGGGGYARSFFQLPTSAGVFSVTVGAGGSGLNAGSSSLFLSFEAEGGSGPNGNVGGDGGSGGGGRRPQSCNRNGGEDGSNGFNGVSGNGGAGQGFSTREFNQVFNFNTNSWVTIDASSTATLYGSGGGAYGSSNTTTGQGGVPGEAAGWGGGQIQCPGHPEQSTLYRNTSGLPNRGGGGGSSRPAGGIVASGGSGIVIVRYEV